MKLIYTSENSIYVNNLRNILENEGIGTKLKNEFVGGILGEVSIQDAWLELWVVNEADYQRAEFLIESAKEPDEGEEWQCSACRKMNAASFEICWSCQATKGG